MQKGRKPHRPANSRSSNDQTIHSSSDIRIWPAKIMRTPVGAAVLWPPEISGPNYTRGVDMNEQDKPDKHYNVTIGGGVSGQFAQGDSNVQIQNSAGAA